MTPNRETVEAEVVPPATSPQKLSDIDEDFLGEVESLLLRMLIGAFKFPFVKLPRMIYRIVRDLFPTFLRMVRIAALGSALGLVVAGPACFAILSHLANDTDVTNLPSLLSTLPELQNGGQLVCYGWSALTSVGSIWGALYIRKRRKKLRNKGVR